MTTPVRLRLSRARGFDLQAHSRATNGLPAVVVTRASDAGNPFTITACREAGYAGTDAEIAEGYRDGFDGLTCGDNRSRAYWHGWRNAQIDRGKIEGDDASRMLARAVLAFPGGIVGFGAHHERVYPELKAMGLAE